MTLIHTPAHTIDYPDRFLDDEADLEYRVRQDTDAEDPRSGFTTEHTALWAYREPALSASAAAEMPEGNLGIEAFARFYEHFDAQRALVATRRYLSVFHPEVKLNVAIQTIRGYSQGDWLDVVAAVSEGDGTPEALINEFRMWAFGDVWTVIPDGKPGLSGIYADTAKEAVEHYRANYEDPVFVHTIEVVVTAADPLASQSKVEQIVAAIHESDALPEGVRVRSFTEPKLER